MSGFTTFVRCKQLPTSGEIVSGAFLLLCAAPRPRASTLNPVTTTTTIYVDAKHGDFIMVPEGLANSRLPKGLLVLVQQGSVTTSGGQIPRFHLAETAEAITVGDVLPDVDVGE